MHFTGENIRPRFCCYQNTKNVKLAYKSQETQIRLCRMFLVMKMLYILVYVLSVIFTLVNVYVDLVVFTRIAGTS